MKQDTKDIVRKILEIDPDSREDDKVLMWGVWQFQGITEELHMHAEDFIKSAIDPESIRRARQKLQHDYPALRPPLAIYLARHAKESRVRKDQSILDQNVDFEKMRQESIKQTEVKPVTNYSPLFD